MNTLRASNLRLAHGGYTKETSGALCGTTPPYCCIATCSPFIAAQTSGTSTYASLNSSDGTTSAKLNEYLNTVTDAGQFSGAVLVAQNGTVLLSRGYGMANYTSCVPNTPQTVFPIASNSKQFTAAAAMKLQEQGRLNVTD